MPLPKPKLTPPQSGLGKALKDKAGEAQRTPTTPGSTSGTMTRSRESPSPSALLRQPVWKGPYEDGVTNSLLNRFLGCRERFRIYAMDGLAAADGFNHRLEYGTMWHLCEEEFAGSTPENWGQSLLGHARQLAGRYPTQMETVDHWYRVCKAQFPAYIDFWRHHQDSQDRSPLLQEYSFRVFYTLPSGRVVLLRGKWDSVDMVRPKRSEPFVALQENKTKGDVHEDSMRRQLSFDCQTMLYLVALKEYKNEFFWRRANKRWRNCPLTQVRYNVVRRPLSGGKHTITRHKAKGSKPEETREHFYNRLAGLIASDPAHFFKRWTVEVTEQDIRTFRQQFLDPVLEQLCDWWDWMSGCYARGVNFWDNDVSITTSPWDDGKPHPSAVHWRHPYGLYNVLDEGGQDELDNYITTGSQAGLTRITTVFPELEVE